MCNYRGASERFRVANTRKLHETVEVCAPVVVMSMQVV